MRYVAYLASPDGRLHRSAWADQARRELAEAEARRREAEITKPEPQLPPKNTDAG